MSDTDLSDERPAPPPTATMRGTLWMLTGGPGSAAGALASRAVAPVAKLGLLVVVGRTGGVAALGAYATVSALAHLLGSLGEAGFTTLLSVPERYLQADPGQAVRASRRTRVGVALSTSAVLALALLGGFSTGDAALRWAIPLPALLALGLTQTGAMNRLGLLALEGRIAVAEHLAGLAVAFGLLAVLDPVAAAFAGQAVGRGGGVLVRVRALARRLPATRGDRVAVPWRRVVPFAGFTAIVVVHGQADLVLLGLVGDPVTAGTYAPVLRLAFVLLLVGEAVSLAALPGLAAAPGWSTGARRSVLRVGGAAMLALGVAGALLVLVGGPFLLPLIAPDSPRVPYALFGALAANPLLRVPGHLLDAWLTGHGHQARKTAVALLSVLLLVPTAALAAAADSLLALALARLLAEVVLVGGWVLLTRATLHGPVSPEQRP